MSQHRSRYYTWLSVSLLSNCRIFPTLPTFPFLHYAQLAREHFSPMISFSLIISIKVLRVVLPQISVEKHVWKIGLFLYLFNRLIFISHFHMNFRQSISVDFFCIACDILLSKQRKLRKRRSVLKLSDANMYERVCCARVCVYSFTNCATSFDKAPVTNLCTQDNLYTLAQKKRKTWMQLLVLLVNKQSKFWHSKTLT